MRLRYIAIIVATLGPPASSGSATTVASDAARDDLRYFVGTWNCSGHFEPSRRPLASDMTFGVEDETGTIRKRHRDRAPGTYVATETWGRSASGGAYRAVIADRSGVRWYDSAGWLGPRWTWTRVTTGTEPAERFIYDRLAEDVMRVDWWVSRAGGPLTLGDTLECRRGPI